MLYNIYIYIHTYRYAYTHVYTSIYIASRSDATVLPEAVTK